MLSKPKVISHQIDINADDFNPNIYHTRGHDKRFLTLMTRIDCYKFYFFPSAINIWNSLPQHVIDLTEIDQFKYSLAGLVAAVFNNLLMCIVSYSKCDQICEKVPFSHILHTSKQNDVTFDSLH